MTARVDGGAEAELVLAYHQRTKHTLERYAARPPSIDWTSQPNPFREFEGSPRTAFPLHASGLGVALSEVYRPDGVPPRPFSRESVGMLLRFSLGLSAWKEYGPDRWAVRCNPSSGNLHPTEAYVLCLGIDDLENGLFHYLSRDHVLEAPLCARRAEGRRGPLGRSSSISCAKPGNTGSERFVIASSIWVMPWCSAYAAALLGWQARLVPSLDDEVLERLLGLDRTMEFAAAERESAGLLLEVTPSGQSLSGVGRPPPTVLDQVEWTGKANVLDPHPLFHWPVIEEVTRALRSTAATRAPAVSTAHPPLCHPADQPLAPVILQRRSAERYDSRHTMPALHFHHLLDCLLPRSAVPWDVWEFTPASTRFSSSTAWRGWNRASTSSCEGRKRRPSCVPGAMVASCGGDRPPPRRICPSINWSAPCAQGRCGTISCHQPIAADGCFSLGMLSEFAGVIRRDAWRYRQLHWEAGLLGQVLYLEAEAAALRGTGIGCYFDDLMHDVLGLKDAVLQSLYNFTVGAALTDERILTLPPYLHTDEHFMNMPSSFQRISVDRARDVLARPDTLVLDARDEVAFGRGRIAAATRVSGDTALPLLRRTPKSTPILIYCYHGNASQEYAQMFVDFGFTEVYSLDGGFDAWHRAESSVLEDATRAWLLDQGFSEAEGTTPRAADGMTPLMVAARLGNLAIAADLLRVGASLETRNADGNTALWMACVGGATAVIDLLLSCGGDVNNQNDNGATCLMYAASKGNEAPTRADHRRHRPGPRYPGRLHRA